MSKPTLEEIVSLCKRRGFIFPGSELYGGLSGTWDYGPLGVAIKRRIANLWWQTFVEERDDVFGLDSAVLMNSKVWQASGHIDTFHDPLIEDLVTKKRYRLDHLLTENGINAQDMSIEEMANEVKKHKILSPDGNELGVAAQFNLMFKTNIGPVDDQNSLIYLRPETAQGMFTNFRNILDTFYPDIPFGIAQIGKTFRNEISARDFLFRVREFEIMEFEYFVNPDKWEEEYAKLLESIRHWYFDVLELSKEHLKEREVKEKERAHYSKKTIDFDYDFPIGFDEIGGFAYRADYDLSAHQRLSGKSMEYIPKDGSKHFIPHVLEPTFGLDRSVLAVLTEAYSTDEINGEKRVFLKLPNKLAPYIVAVSPLLKNKKELVDKAREVYEALKKDFTNITWDDNGNIGKRYRRQDEIGTPYCVTVDFDTLEDGTVTLRSRDTTEQKRLKIEDLAENIK